MLDRQPEVELVVLDGSAQMLAAARERLGDRVTYLRADLLIAAALRTGDPSVVARIEHGRCLIDLRCVDPADDARVADAVRAVVPPAHHDQG